jgi:hypothetical protein
MELVPLYRPEALGLRFRLFVYVLCGLPISSRSKSCDLAEVVKGLGRNTTAPAAKLPD